MGKRRMVFRMSLLSAALVAATSCQSGQHGPSSGMFSPSAAPRANDVANDYTKPYLSDEKMQKFLTSMKEEHNPFELIFKQGGGLQNPADLTSRLEEFNSFARRYGFQDYQGYTAVWGRIMVGEAQIAAADMVKDTAKSFQKMIDDAQADLKKPDLSPEQRKMDEDQIAGAQKTIHDISESGSNSLNEADMALVTNYKDQIDAAEKKYNASK